MKKLAYAVASLCAFALVSGAAAQEATMVVKVSDLNLKTETGAGIALQRIRLAARGFCDSADIRDLGRSALVEACRQDMTDKAVSRLGAPVLTALYAKARAVEVAAK